MRNIEILNLVEALNNNIEELKKLKGAKFAYAIIKNLETLNTESKVIQSVYTISDEYKEYDKARVDLCERYADKDENGQPIKNYITDKSFEYKLDLTNQVFISAMDELTQKYKDSIITNNEKSLEYNKFLMEESTIKFTDIDFSTIPDDISVELLSVIKPFVKD